MLRTKVLFSVFNITLRSYSSKLFITNRVIPQQIRYAKRYVASSSNIISFEEFKTSLNDKNIIVIDVRRPDELIEDGKIPGSINIPLDELKNALNSSNEQFRRHYGINKPTPETLIIFSCKLGRRSEEAYEIAKQLGYKNSKNYKGGWIEWQSKVAL